MTDDDTKDPDGPNESELHEPGVLRCIREHQERLGYLVDSPLLRSIREHQERLDDLVDPPLLRSIREHQERLLDTFSDRTSSSLTSVTAFARSAEFFAHGACVIESALRLGHLQRDADTAALAAIGIAKLVGEISAANFRPVGDLLEASVDFFESPLEDTPPALVGALPPEVFRALDLDTALRDGTPGLAGDERDELASRASDELDAALAEFDPALAALLLGARQAILSDNPDRTRHVSISLRELLGHVLRRLAPDSAVGAWTQAPAHFHNGRPTRKARFEYLYSAVAAPALRRLIEADIRAAIELLDVLSNGSHVASLGASGTALVLLMTRAEGVLLLLLRLDAHRQGSV